MPEDGKFVVAQTSRSPTNQISAVQVNKTTGAPTLFGSSLRRATSPGGSADGGQVRAGMSHWYFWENNVTFPYYYFNPSSGMQLVTADLSSTLRGHFNPSNDITTVSSIEDSGVIYWRSGNGLKSMTCDSSTHLVSGTATTLTPAADVLSNFKSVQEEMTENFRDTLKTSYNPINLVLHTYDIFKNLKGITV